MPRRERRDPDKERYWRGLLRAWRRSGLTGRDFCAERGLNESSFYAWRREIARRDGEKPAEAVGAARPPRPRPAAGTAVPAFMRVMVDGAAGVPAAIEVVVAERWIMRVRPGFDAELLRQLLRVLEEPSC